MTNPFLEITEKLQSLENLILAMQPVQQIPTVTNKVEPPISQSEAVVFLGKSRATLINWRKKGVITAYHLGGRIYYKRSELLSALQKLG